MLTSDKFIRIKINHPCPICNKEIYLDENTTKKNSIFYHLKCYIDEKVNNLKGRIDIIDNSKNYDKGNGIVSADSIKEEIDKTFGE